MANLIESAVAWVAGVRQIETTDPVAGGPPNDGTGAGMVNIPHKQLADRTAFLKAGLDALSAIALTTANSPRLLAQNGHFQIGPAGLIIQWGRVQLDAAVTTVAFPRAFPAACLGVFCQDLASGSTPDDLQLVGVLASAMTATSFQAAATNRATGSGLTVATIQFLALGH